MVTGFAAASTAALALYGSIDRLGNQQLALDRANLQVQRSTNAVEQAQADLTAAITEFGAASPEAAAAAEKLSMAQEKLAIDTANVENRQNNLNQAYVELAITVVPTLITATDGLIKLWGNLGPAAEKVKGVMGGLNESLSTHKAAWVGVGAGMGAIMSVMAAFNAKSEEERAMFSLLTGALVALAAAQWIWNTAKAFGLGLTGIGLALVGTAAAAAGATYLLSSQYGAPIGDQSGAAGAIQGGGGAGTQYILGEDGSTQGISNNRYTDQPLTRQLYDDQIGTLWAGAEGSSAANLAQDLYGNSYVLELGKWKKIPQMAEGGIVKATPGGVPVILGEGGYDERVTPLKRGRSAAAAGGGTVINVYLQAPVYSQEVPRLVAQAVRDELAAQQRRN
jgi:hypothetical protein